MSEDGKLPDLSWGVERIKKELILEFVKDIQSFPSAPAHFVVEHIDDLLKKWEEKLK